MHIRGRTKNARRSPNRLVPCFNFYQQLLWHREKLEVLEPQYVRDEIKTAILKMLEHYNE